ncbi:MAG: right-handed parallel beta-helix repeat-containing protein [Bacteroidetes bacterium]|nr:right-handed parallel beta-helix repeat-containing protein [Bacteroidota bacterium]
MKLINTRFCPLIVFVIVCGLFFLQIFTAIAFGKNYYVSSSGNDANNGTSTSTPWKTISKVNSFTFVSGDAVYLRGGDTFYGQININQSGITIGAYDNSIKKPVITGAVKISGWSVHSGSIYVAQASSFVRNLFANGVQMTLARYPNSGFIPISTTDGNTTLSSDAITQASGFWTGANWRGRTNAWTFENIIVTGHNGTTLTLASKTRFTMKAKWGFYLDNKLAALDTEREWYCDPATNKVYFYALGGINPNNLTVYGSVLDYGITSAGNSITVKDLDFYYQCKAGINLSGSGCSVLSNTIFGGLSDGIIIGYGSDCAVNANIIQNVNGNGIHTSGKYCTISNNTVKSVGLIKGYQSYAKAYGIMADGTNTTIGNNYIDSTGYTGIYGASYSIIRQNVINNTMMTLADGSAIYLGSNSSYAAIQNNIISNVEGHSEGAPSYGGIYESWNSSNGIYLDNGSSNNIVTDNTIIRAKSMALMTNCGSHNNTLSKNTCYDCASNAGGFFLFVGVNTATNDGGHVITKNIFYPGSNKQPMLQFKDVSSVIHSPGIMDSNYYCNPYGYTYPFETLLYKSSAWSAGKYTFAGWTALSGLDTHSKYIVPESTKRDTMFVNSTASPVTVNLPPFLFNDLDNNSVSGSFTLAPFSSRILIRDNEQITSNITVNPASLSFGSVAINTISAERTYTIQGTNLLPAIGNVTITPTSAVYQVSLTSGSGFTSSLNISYSDGTLSSRTIYVRFSPTIAQSYSGNISNSGGSAATKNITLTGTGISASTVIPYPAYSPNIYGSAVNAEVLMKYAITTNQISYRFRAKHTGYISGIRTYIRSRLQSNSSDGGNGGTWKISFRPDIASTHWPSQSIRTYVIRNMEADIGATFPLLIFKIPVGVTEGTLYHIVFENLDANPAINYSSIKTLTTYRPLTQFQPFAADTDWEVLVSKAAPYTTWTKPADNSYDTPIMEYYYTDGYSTGMGYMESWIDNIKSISGNSAVRETFTVKGISRDVSNVKVWVRRLSGSDPLIVRLEKTDGSLLEQGSIPAASIPTAYSWINYTFQSTRNLVLGQSYNLTLSSSANSVYNTYALSDGGSTFTENARFADGYSEFNVGNGWTGWDQWGRTNLKTGDLMFYFSNSSGEASKYIENSNTKDNSGDAHPMHTDLKQNYPNPFNPSTVINYQLSDAGMVRLSVYDILGREVAVLVNDKKEAGFYSVTFNGRNLPSGVYFTRFISNSENGKQIVQTKKMLLVE